MTFVINYFTIPILIYLKFISKFSMTVGTLLTTETAVLKLNKFQVIVRWSSRGDLNLQPFGYQSRTLISTAHRSQYKLQVQKEGLIKIMVNCIINQCVQIRKAFWPQLLRSLDTAPLPAPPPAPQASVQNAPDELGSFHGYSLEVLCSQIAFKCIRVTEPVLKSFKRLYGYKTIQNTVTQVDHFFFHYVTLIVWSSITLQNGPYAIAISYLVILEQEYGIFLSKWKTCPQ